METLSGEEDGPEALVDEEKCSSLVPPPPAEVEVAFASQADGTAAGISRAVHEVEAAMAGIVLAVVLFGPAAAVLEPEAD